MERPIIVTHRQEQRLSTLPDAENDSGSARASSGEGIALLAALAELGVRVTDAMARAIDDSGVLSNETVQVLIHLNTSGPSRPSVLADHLGTSRPQITKLLGQLEQQQLIERTHETEPDRRVVTVTLTPTGRSVIDAADAILQDGFDDVAPIIAAIDGFLSRT
jgi:DNA-binding MarR family transcriptional regulator